MEITENKYKEFFKYLTGDDIEAISKDVTISESTVRKYLNGDVPESDLAKIKFEKVITCSINILKNKSEEILKMINNE